LIGTNPFLVGKRSGHLELDVFLVFLDLSPLITTAILIPIHLRQQTLHALLLHRAQPLDIPQRLLIQILPPRADLTRELLLAHRLHGRLAMPSVLFFDRAMGTGVPVRRQLDVAIFGGAVRVVVRVVVRWVEGGRDGVIGGRGLEEEVPFEAEEDGVGRVRGGDLAVGFGFGF
jgi:hypothetical protein